MPCGIDDALALLDQLEEVRRTELTRYTKLEVGGHTFGYLWYPTRTIGLKQTLEEQLALTAERPDVFEVQFTAGGFGWIVVHLEGIERDELAELVFEAWRLTAPQAPRAARKPVAGLSRTTSYAAVCRSRACTGTRDPRFDVHLADDVS